MALSNPFELSSLNGDNGFIIKGINEGDRLGWSVSRIGDLNHDGIDDLIVGASSATPNDHESAGASYIIFGREKFTAEIDLTALDGTNGFVLNGINSKDYSGRAVSGAGDFNGDGVDDLLIGALHAESNGFAESSGESYIVFGSQDEFSASLNLADLDGNNGLTINNIDTNDQSGISVSELGDINGDNVDDIIIGSWGGDPNDLDGAGESMVIFGSQEDFGARLSRPELDGSNGFTINGIEAGDASGASVSGAGDINGDGLNDIIIGAHFAEREEKSRVGEAYVVFGAPKFDANFELSNLNGINGFILEGIDEQDFTGFSVSGAGDINGDSYDDIVIGARSATVANNSSAGKSYIVFGKQDGFSSRLNLADLDGSNGFVINGSENYFNLGISVSEAGDVNQDDIEDLIITESYGSRNGTPLAPRSTIIYGSREPFKASISISEIDGTNGVLLKAPEQELNSLGSVSNVGDVNNDGIEDLIIGNPGSVSTVIPTGESYVVFGSSNLAPKLITVQNINLQENRDLVIDLETNDDSDSESQGLIYSITSGTDRELFSLDPVTGELRFLELPDFEAPEDGDVNNQYLVQVSVTDSENLTNKRDLTITVTDEVENTPPIITSPKSIKVSENSTNVVDIEITDDFDTEDSGITYTLAGSTDRDLFALDTATGELSFVTIPDFENPADFNGDNNYQVQIFAIDTGGLMDTYDLNVTVTDELENMPPVITSSNDFLSIVENKTLVIDIDSDDDLDSEGFGLTYSIEGGEDQALFSIDHGTGKLSFITTPDFENPHDGNQDNEYLVQVKTTDTEGLTDTKDLTIIITDEVENTPPIVATMNGEIRVMENSIEVIDVFSKDDTSSEGDGLSYSLSGGNDQKLFYINADTGELVFKSAPDFENPDDDNEDNKYLVQIQVTDAGSLTSTENLTIAIIDEAEINGTNKRDRLIGTDNDDIIHGLDNKDTLTGNGGADILDGGNNNDLLMGNDGNDILIGGEGQDTLFGNAGADILDGGIANDRLIGQIGADVLNGKAGNDVLIGGGDDDILRGGEGDDSLNGGGGSDTFILAVGDGTDKFRDFAKGKDIIGLADGLTFNDLSFSGRNILVGDETLAVLNLQTDSLRESDFLSI